MAKAKAKPAQEVRLPTSYEAVGLRIQKIINSPAAQKLKSATVSKLPGAVDRGLGWSSGGIRRCGGRDPGASGRRQRRDLVGCAERRLIKTND